MDLPYQVGSDTNTSVPWTICKMFSSCSNYNFSYPSEQAAALILAFNVSSGGKGCRNSSRCDGCTCVVPDTLYSESESLASSEI